MDKHWLKRNNEFTPIEGDFSTPENLPVGIYNVTLTMSGWHLEKTADKFEFPDKIYGLQTSRIEYILKTYYNTTGNLGVLLNGVKGAGKTWMAKQIANTLNLPIINVRSMGDRTCDMIEFLSNIKGDCVFFFDEYEKNFEQNGEDNSACILQFMDGVYTSEYRRVFLLTTNNKNINDNLLGRPSRIRYVVEFGNLPVDTLMEYLKDNLKDQSCIKEVVEFLSDLSISTIDILKTLVNEINIHGVEAFGEIRKIFNITYNQTTLSCVRASISNRLINKSTLEEIVKEYLKHYAIHRKREDMFCEGMFEQAKDIEVPVSFHYTSIQVPCRFSNLKVGDEFGRYYRKVVYVDKENHALIILDTDDSEYHLYIVENETRDTAFNAAEIAF